MANLLKSVLIIAMAASTAEAITFRPNTDPESNPGQKVKGDPIDGDGVANYCETSADCGGNLGTGMSCGWYKRHEGTREGRCIPTALCGKEARPNEEASLMICPE